MRGTRLMLDVRMELHSVETLPFFRMPSLQSLPHSCSARIHGAFGGGARGFRNRFEQWEKLAVHGCSSRSSKGVSIWNQSPGGELQRNVVLRGLEQASNDFETTDFFMDELKEAKMTLDRLAEAENSIGFFHPWQDEKTSQRKEDEDKLPENLDIGQGLESGRSGKLPLESNGPPMVVLEPYLKDNNSQEQAKEKLPMLPLPMPHKKRPAGLPRPSLRRRFGIAFSRKKVPSRQDSDSSADI